MLEAIRRAVSFLRQRQILHKLGVVVSITVIAIACYVLYHMLRGIDSNEVIEAIKSTEPRQIWLAALFVAAGFFTLTLYAALGVCGSRLGYVSCPLEARPRLSPPSYRRQVPATACPRAARVRPRTFSP